MAHVAAITHDELLSALDGASPVPSRGAAKAKRRYTFSELDRMSNARLIAHCEARDDLSPEAQVLLDRLLRSS